MTCVCDSLGYSLTIDNKDVQSLKLDDYGMTNGDLDDDDPFSANTFEV